MAKVNVSALMKI